MLALSSFSTISSLSSDSSLDRHVSFARRPSYIDLGDQDEDFWDEQDEQFREPEHDESFDLRSPEMQRRSQPWPVGPPQTDLRSKLTNRPIPSPPRFDVPSVGAARAASSSKLPYRRADASASTPSLGIHARSASAPIPVPILKNGTGKRQASVDDTVTKGLGLTLGSAPSSSHDPASLQARNPHLKMVNGELRMTVFPERKGSFGGKQIVRGARGTSGSESPSQVEDGSIMMQLDQLEKEQERVSAELAKRTRSPERGTTPSRPPPPIPVTVAAATSSVTHVRASAESPSALADARESLKTTSPQPRDIVTSSQKRDSLIDLVPRNHVLNIVGELMAAAQRKAPPPPPPPRAASPPPLKPSSKWVPVDTSAGLKRKWEPGSRVPSSLRSYMHLLGGGAHN
ncbi:hypothetical protein EXIGLDRAFT_372779 [Exidia glandulosa HHB12029]|uniref:Uncharacterized protein n=1 Tax=Exidia glandulosa HHB12029 TaxID=1314781 RepID=A0A166BNP9_EXIGL|nr:hypothetical protein EXIGLDRAFT_372779 [Exidia glandulosa HHB12029]